MGTPCHNWQLQSQNKLYRLLTPATPLFRPVHHDNINMDEFSMGTNAIVAVISYTVSKTCVLSRIENYVHQAIQLVMINEKCIRTFFLDIILNRESLFLFYF